MVLYMEKAKKAFGYWLALTAAEREAEDESATQAEFADRWGVTGRTLIRWKQNDPTVLGAYEKTQRARGGPDVPPEAHAYPKTDDFQDLDDSSQIMDSPLVGDVLTQEFEEIRRALVAGAKRGGKGLDSYMRYVGRHILDQERAARESGFADLSDEELVHEVLSLLGRDSVVAYSQGAGWIE